MSNTQDLSELYPHLCKINSPEDLQKLPAEDLPALAEEIRAFLIDKVLENGGHLASNLGVVELSLAIHRVFSSPHDHVIFDVGHQSYIHKLITGRREHFDTLRRGGGMSGFPKRTESEHDCFGTGHSSTSLSAALGFAEADRLAGSDAYTVCVLGDGAYTGGMIHEALNNCRKRLRLIIIINENEMSISKNIGRFARTLSRLRATKGYYKTKSATTSVLRKLPLIGKPMFRLLRRVKIGMKSVLYGSNYFEDLGLYYLGPVNGNDEESVELLLKEAKESRQSCVIHVKTQKGKGYAPAEETPSAFHGVAPADKTVPQERNFSAEMGSILTELAHTNEKICAITAAMADGTGLVSFKEQHPTRFFDVGIAEEHAVTFAAGLSANGFRPVVALYSTFLQRAYDNIIHDVALQKLPVVFCVDRAGLNASDGATHHGLFDVAFLSQIPDLKLYTPITRRGLRNALTNALKDDVPSAIRYPNGYENPQVVAEFFNDGEDEIRVRTSYDPKTQAPDVIIITHGRIVTEAMKARDSLQDRLSVGILLLEQLKPYDKIAEEVAKLLPSHSCQVLFLEEEIKAGGMGMMLSCALAKAPVMQNKKTVILATDDHFAVQERDEPIWKTAAVDADHIVAEILQNQT
ncbi:MAG: 1-deoxy-D-xylulose-5-phosphate synthase [Ruminococcaceae bacterium]|nr:1-deoxy-D-xylulose-5-phosphate synthase [Oscillospiraceae bacterium]